MKNYYPPLMAIFLMLASCQGQSPRSTDATDSDMTEFSAEQQGPQTAVGAPRYTIHGLVDPGIRNMVAYAFKAPAKWQFRQSFTRIWNGATPINQIHIQLSAPDGTSSIEFLPATPYFFQDGPTSRSLRQTSQQMGLASRHQPGEMPPMHPLDYLRSVILPGLAQNGLRIRENGNHSFPPQPTGQGMKSSAYIDGSAADGRRIRVECTITTTQRQMGGETFYNWQASPSVTQSSTDLEGCFAMTQQIRTSVVFNPAWVQENSRLASRGNSINNYFNNKDADAVRDFRNYQNTLRQKTLQDNSDMASRHSQEVGDVLAGTQKYDDPLTGKRSTQQAGYNHVYKERNGDRVLYTNQPLEAGQVDWQELQKVETGH